MSFFAEEFLDMLVDVIVVRSLIGRADDNTPQYGSPRAYPSRINYETQNVIGKDGQLATASGVIWMACVDLVRVDDMVIFPDGAEPTILKVAAGSDESGPAYTKLYFQ